MNLESITPATPTSSQTPHENVNPTESPSSINLNVNKVGVERLNVKERPLKKIKREDAQQIQVLNQKEIVENKDIPFETVPPEIWKFIFFSEKYNPSFPQVCTTWNEAALHSHQMFLDRAFAELGPERTSILERRIQKDPNKHFSPAEKMHLLVEDQQKRLDLLLPNSASKEVKPLGPGQLFTCMEKFVETEQMIKDIILIKACRQQQRATQHALWQQILGQTRVEKISLDTIAKKSSLEIHEQAEILRQRLNGEEGKSIHSMISQIKLLEIPEEFFNLNLTIININPGGIFHVPSSLGKLQSLQVLCLSGGELDRLPADLKILRCLKTCNLSNNLFTEFPEVLCPFPQLENLLLANNRITALPKAIDKMTKLHKLELSGNSIAKLPDDVDWKKLENLKELRFSDNKLKEVPLSLFEVPNLKHLCLNGNLLTQLPNMECAKNLKKLHISKNCFSYIPESILKLNNIETLDISFNPLELIPPEILKIPNLKCLIISEGQKRLLPDARDESIIKVKKAVTIPAMEKTYIVDQSSESSEDDNY